MLSGFILYFGLFTVLAYNGRDSDVSGDTVKDVIEDITERCFGAKIQGSWDVYHYNSLDCTSIRRVMSIVPTCDHCTSPMVAAFNWKECYIMQKAACSQSVYCPTYCTCQKIKGKTFSVPKIPSGQTDAPKASTTASPHPNEPENIPGTTDATNSHWPNHGHPSPDTGEDTGDTVPVAIAGGLFAAGLVLGSVITALLCVCVPCCDRRHSSVHDKIDGHPLGQTETENSTMSTGDHRTNGVIGVHSPAYNSTYHPLSARPDPHSFSAHDQGMIYTEPMEGRGTYLSPVNQPMKKGKAVQSPVYNQFHQGDVINARKQPVESKPSGTYQELDHTLGHDPNRYGTIVNDNSQKSNSNQPTRDSDTSELANHNYHILEPETAGQSLPNQDDSIEGHQYFVLESDPNPVPGTSSKDNVDESDNCQHKKHEYMVLENTST